MASVRPSTIAWWAIVLGAVAIGVLALAGCAQQSETAPLGKVPVASVPAPQSAQPREPANLIIDAAPDRTCVRLPQGLKPFSPAKPDDKPAFGQYIEQTQAVNGTVKEHHLAVYDGRQWWDVSGLQECGK